MLFLCLALLELSEEVLIECAHCIDSVGLDIKVGIAQAILEDLEKPEYQLEIELHEEQLQVIGEELADQLIHLQVDLLILSKLAHFERTD